jgi:preprotein translocase subunit SecG
MSYLYYLLAFLFGVVCVFLILLILIQKGRGGGLSGAFGGAGGNTAFGTKTGDLLTWVTSVVFGVFLLLSCGLIWTTDAVHARERSTQPLLPDDTLSQPLDADGDGQVEPIAPTDDQSSLPGGIDTPAPAADPADDGTPDEQ